jgi:phosphoribosyl 1,2-cyclic phosphodiesterase
MNEKSDVITFLGTAGARFMIIKQLLASGGIWLSLAGKEILLDPGPGSLVQAIKLGLSPEKLDAIILSHKHIDHSVDINVMIEAMTDGGFNHRGIVFVPADALGYDGVVLRYLHKFPEKIEILQEHKEYSVGEVVFRPAVRHQHPVETYGFVFKTPKHVFSTIVDTKYFADLQAYYEGELLIINMVLVEPRHSIDHLSPEEVKQIINRIKPKVAIITHFGMGVWKAKPPDIAKKLSEETGYRVIAAQDGMMFDLDKM